MRFYFIERLEKYNLSFILIHVLRLEKYNLSFILIHVFQIFLNLIFYLGFEN